MICLLLLLLLAFPLEAQTISPHIGYVYPAGGRQGTTFQAKIGGQFLEGATNLYVSGAGVQARVLGHTKPLTPKQFNDLREKLRAMQQQRQAANRRWRRRNNAAQSSTNAVTWTAVDERLFNEIRRKLLTFQRRPANPAIAETVTLQVTMAANAEPGQRELRLRSQLGLSNPLVFCVGQLHEFRKPEVRADDAPGFRRPFRNQTEQKSTPPTESRITIPAVVNGQTLPGGVDRFRFQARKGQHLVVMVNARKLIPYLADAVPGWFQAAVTLKDAKGNELAYGDHYEFHPDPVLYYEVPKDGEYLVELRDSVYRGREDFVYRIAIGELPFVTSIFPLGGPAGAQTKVELTGWNLPLTRFTQDNRDKAPGIYPLSLGLQQPLANEVPFAVDSLPEMLEQEPNNSLASAQAITLPVIINGRIQAPGDWDVFRFEGRAGQVVVAEVYARRLNSPLDSVLKLTDATGRQLAFNDDHEDKGCGLNTHHADSYLMATLPANGAYYVHLGEAQHRGGPDFAYRLRVSAPRPDFALRVTPSSINARPGLSVPLTVYALRRDGFTNEIALALQEAPARFSLSGARIPANQDQVRLTLTVPAGAPAQPVDLTFEGRAFIQGRPVSHVAVPAEDMMQAFAYRHLVPARELKVAVVGNGRFGPRMAVRLLDDGPVKIPAGGTARVHVAMPARGFVQRMQLELNQPPAGVTIRNVALAPAGAEIVLSSDAAKAKCGLSGNLIVNVLPRNLPAAAKKAKRPANARRPPLGVLPAIPFEIVAPE
jgi:hypothetical protein